MRHVKYIESWEELGLRSRNTIHLWRVCCFPPFLPDLFTNFWANLFAMWCKLNWNCWISLTAQGTYCQKICRTFRISRHTKCLSISLVSLVKAHWLSEITAASCKWCVKWRGFAHPANTEKTSRKLCHWTGLGGKEENNCDKSRIKHRTYRQMQKINQV